jgi:hypothetical protein
MRLLFVAFGLAGAALLVLACVLGYGKYQLVRDSVRSTGQVVAYFDSSLAAEVADPKPRPGHLFFPVIEFRGPGGAPLRFNGGTGGATPQPGLGSKVAVLYARDHPAQAMLDEPQALWGLPLAAAAFGLPLLMLGMFGHRLGG